MYSRKVFLHSFLVVLFLFSLPVGVVAFDRDKTIVAILSSAESLFQSMERRDYREIWDHLTSKSKDHIVRTVHRESRKVELQFSREDIASDFAEGGPLAQAYWNSYLVHFDPDTALTRSAWSMGTVKGRSAEIILLYEKAEYPAILKMFKEDDQWKVGLDESFRGRRLLQR